MAILCPYCRFTIELTGVKPGRFKPRCPGCGERFGLIVPEGEREPIVKKLETAAAPKGDGQHAGTAKPPAAKAPTPKPRRQPGALSTSPTAATLPTRAQSGAADAATLVQQAPSPTGGASPTLTGTRLGGYEIEQELGRGAMGVVYRARQVSLDRPVAVKVMNPQWAADPIFVSRFTREAYAAAHLVHHNVVQIYDIGFDHDVNFFSMEFVDGRSLVDVLDNAGRIDVEQAVGYVLQAARGLKFAHDSGMVHRDIKPDNLLLNAQGIVKVADLGLVKTPDSGADDALDALSIPGAAPRSARARELTGAGITRAQSGMGTPAYMAPEQAMDSAQVDHRADIYSLGCTLYVLLTGRYVHDAHTTQDLLTKVKTERVPPPDELEQRVPRGLSDIIMRMVAPNREQRYQDLGEVIDTLERFLGVESAAHFTPGEKHVVALERAAADFNASRAAGLRRRIIAAFYGGCALVTVTALLLGMTGIGLAALLTPLFTTVFHQAIVSMTGGSALTRRTRVFLLEGRLVDWLMGAVVLVVFLVLLGFLGLQGVALGAAIVALLLAAGFRFSVDRWVKADQHRSLDAIQSTLRMMRERGLDEDSIQQFVCKYGGDRWEPLFEAAFGYDAKLAARQRWGRGEQGRMRRKSGAWRDPIISWLDRRIADRRSRREQRHLQRVERSALVAQGVSPTAATRQAATAVTSIMASAAIVRERAAHVPKPRKIVVRTAKSTINSFIGGRTRFIVGACLLIGCLLWMNQNGLIPGREISTIGEEISEGGGAEGVAAAGESMWNTYKRRVENASPLNVSWLPSNIGSIFDGFAPGVAGLVLVLSALVPGWLITVLLIPGVGVMMLGERYGIPGMWGVSSEYISLALGFFLCIPAWLIGR